jgi:thiol-disulfide isomerase/thioredoxin
MTSIDKILLSALLSLGITAVANAEIKTGDIFPSLESASVVGGKIPDLTNHVALVDFWASWCAPCKESFPAYAQLNADFTARGLVVLAISVDQNAEAYRSFVKRMNPSFATVCDKDQQIVREVNIPVMPTCYVLGRDGRVRFVHHGFHGAATEQEIRRELDALLAETSSPPLK